VFFLIMQTNSFWLFWKDWIFIYRDDNPTPFMPFSPLFIIVLFIFFWICLKLVYTLLILFLSLQLHFGELLSLPTTIKGNEDQIFIPQNCDQRPSLMEKNSIARVYEVMMCFFLIIISYYDNWFLLTIWKRLDVYLYGWQSNIFHTSYSFNNFVLFILSLNLSST